MLDVHCSKTCNGTLCSDHCGVCVVKSDEKYLKLSEDPSWFLLISKALYSYHWILRDRVLWKAFPDPRLLG